MKESLETKILRMIARHSPLTDTKVKRIFEASGSFDRTIALIEQGLSHNVDPEILATAKVEIGLEKGMQVLRYKSRIDDSVVFKLKVA